MDGWTVTYVEREKDKYRGTEKKIKSEINRQIDRQRHGVIERVREREKDRGENKEGERERDINSYGKKNRETR